MTKFDIVKYREKRFAEVWEQTLIRRKKDTCERCNRVSLRNIKINDKWVKRCVICDREDFNPWLKKNKGE